MPFPSSTPAFWWKNPPTLAAQLLKPLAWAYAKIATWHGQHRAKHAYYPAIPTISVGNLTVGGGGKTPLTLWLAEHFLTQNQHQIAIISRGYGGTETTHPTQVMPHHTAAQVGDEPMLYFNHFIGKPVTIWVGKHRPSVVKRAEQAGATLLILDDGFQRQDVARHANLLAINGQSPNGNPWGNQLTLPAGPLREALTALKRAHFGIVIDEPATHANTYYGLPTYRLFTSATPETLAPLQNQKLVAFAGLAHPEKFFQTLHQNHLNVVQTIPFPDHHLYTKTDLKNIQTIAKKYHAIPVTTAKDAPKLPQNFAQILKINLQGEDSQSIHAELAKLLA